MLEEASIVFKIKENRLRWIGLVMRREKSEAMERL